MAGPIWSYFQLIQAQNVNMSIRKLEKLRSQRSQKVQGQGLGVAVNQGGYDNLDYCYWCWWKLSMLRSHLPTVVVSPSHELSGIKTQLWLVNSPILNKVNE